MTRTAYTLTILVGASLGLAGGVAACTDGIEDGSTNQPPTGSTAGSEDGTFDHDNNQISVWELIDRLSKEGPPSFTSHMHSCAKIHYTTLGNVLRAVGVNTGNTTPLSAGDLYRTGGSAMGAPQFASRIRENIDVTTSQASRLFDIFAAGADEIIAAVPTLARCPGAQLFDAAGTSCIASGITCLIGAPALPEHVGLCSTTIARASSAAVGRRLAVAAMMAAAYTCE